MAHFSAVGRFIPGSERRLVELKVVNEHEPHQTRETLRDTLMLSWAFEYDGDAAQIASTLLMPVNHWLRLSSTKLKEPPTTIHGYNNSSVPIIARSGLAGGTFEFKGFRCFRESGSKVEVQVNWYFVFDTEANELHIYYNGTSGKSGTDFPLQVVRLGKMYEGSTRFTRGALYVKQEERIKNILYTASNDESTMFFEGLWSVSEYETNDEVDEFALDYAYKELTELWGWDTRFYGHTQGYVLRELHREALEENSHPSIDYDEDDETDDTEETIKTYQESINGLKLFINSTIDNKQRMVAPLKDYRRWDKDFNLTVAETNFIRQVVGDIVETAPDYETYAHRLVWWVLKEIHLEVLSERQSC